MTGLSLERALLDAGITITPDKTKQLIRDDNSQWLIYREDILPNGKMKRWAKFGDWKLDTNHYWESYSTQDVSPAERLEFEAMAKVNKENERIEKAARQKVASEEAKLFIQSCFDRGDAPYLKLKGINTLPEGGFIDLNCDSPAVVVPMFDINDTLWNIQRIYIEDGKPKKRFLTGGKITTCFFPFKSGISTPESKIFITEGFATGASIFEALTRSEMVVSALTAQNLWPVAQAFRNKYPNSKIIICADNDQFTKINEVFTNIGLIKGAEAAQKCGGKCIYPTFPNDLLHHKPTDFNDLHKYVSLSEVRNQIENFKEVPAVLEAAVVADTKGKGKKPSERMIAQLFLKEFEGNLVKYEHDLFAYTGTHWELQTSTDIETIKAKISDAVTSFGVRDVDNTFRYMRMHLPTPPRGVNLYQPNSTAANFLNGTLHVDRLTFKSEFKPHNRNDYLTSTLRFNYPAASQRKIRNAEFDAMLNRIWEGDVDIEDKKRVYAQAMGACLISAFPQFFIFVGGSGTGKSTAILIANRLVHEDNTCNVSPHSFEGFGMESMIGKLVNFDTDISTHKAISDDVLKKVRDRVPVTIRRKGIKDIKAPLPAVHLFGANKMPKSFEGDSKTFNKRFTVIKVDKFKAQDGSEDLNFVENLFSASPVGIVNFAIDGLEDLLASRGHYHKPESSVVEMESWNEDSDPMGQFFKELKEGEITDQGSTIKMLKEAKIERRVFWNMYKSWFEDEKGFRPKSGKKHFFIRARQENFEEKKTNGVLYFSGVELLVNQKSVS